MSDLSSLLRCRPISFSSLLPFDGLSGSSIWWPMICSCSTPSALRQHPTYTSATGALTPDARSELNIQFKPDEFQRCQCRSNPIQTFTHVQDRTVRTSSLTLITSFKPFRPHSSMKFSPVTGYPPLLVCVCPPSPPGIAWARLRLLVCRRTMALIFLLFDTPIGSLFE